MSKKDMRAASNIRSPSRSKSCSSSPHPSLKRKALSPEHDDHRSSPRKVGRPRTKSMSQVVEPYPKRLRSSSLREKAPLFDSPNCDSTKGRRANERPFHEDAIEEEGEDDADRRAMADAEKEDKIKLANKIREEEDSRKAKEKADWRAAQQQEEERKAEVDRKEEEKRVAEKERLEMAAAREREEDERRQKEQERLRQEQLAAEERRVKRSKQLLALPSALRHILEDQTAMSTTYLVRHFTPIQAVRASALKAELSTELGDDEPLMLNYQAAGLLGGDAAAHLLGLELEPRVSPSPFGDDRMQPVADEERNSMLAALRSSTLVHDLPTIAQTKIDTMFAEIAAAEQRHRTIRTDRIKFLTMPLLRWIKVKQFFAVKALLNPPHLENMELALEFDSSINSDAPHGSINGEVNGTTPNGAVDKHELSLAKSTGNGNRLFSGVDRGKTKVAIIQD